MTCIVGEGVGLITSIVDENVSSFFDTMAPFSLQILSALAGLWAMYTIFLAISASPKFNLSQTMHHLMTIMVVGLVLKGAWWESLNSILFSFGPWAANMFISSATSIPIEGDGIAGLACAAEVAVKEAGISKLFTVLWQHLSMSQFIVVLPAAIIITIIFAFFALTLFMAFVPYLGKLLFVSFILPLALALSAIPGLFSVLIPQLMRLGLLASFQIFSSSIGLGLCITISDRIVNRLVEQTDLNQDVTSYLFSFDFIMTLIMLLISVVILRSIGEYAGTILNLVDMSLSRTSPNLYGAMRNAIQQQKG